MCQTTDPAGSARLTPPPPERQVLCPAEITAPSIDEPVLAPGVVGRADFETALVRAFGADWTKAYMRFTTALWPEWARQGWRRLDAARSACAAAHR